MAVLIDLTLFPEFKHPGVDIVFSSYLIINYVLFLMLVDKYLRNNWFLPT